MNAEVFFVFNTTMKTVEASIFYNDLIYIQYPSDDVPRPTLAFRERQLDIATWYNKIIRLH